MADSTKSQTVPTNDQNQSESNPSSPSTTPDLGDADPAPTRVHVKRPFPRRGYFDVRDASKAEYVMLVLGFLISVVSLGFFVYYFLGTEYRYLIAYRSLLTASSILRLFYKWYRVQGGFDDFTSLLGDFTPGAFGLIIALWGNEWKVILAVNAFSVFFDIINLAIQWFQSYIKIPIKGNVKKFLRAKQFRDRYEEIGISGLLPCNEATNKIKESRIIGGKYYTLGKVDHETPVSDAGTPVSDVETPVSDEETPVSDEQTDGNDVETPVSDDETDVNDVETPAETLASLRAQKKIRWVIGTMMVSYSDNDDWVTIKQKAEERAVKIFMERFTEEQKCNFIEMMEAWKKRPDQGILKKIGRKRSHCFNLARLIDLTNQGFSVYLETTKLRTIEVGAEVDTCVEDFIDSICEVLEVVYNRAARQKSIIVAIIAVVVMFNLSTV